MITYESYETSTGNIFVKRTDASGNEAFIPNDPSNSDYQRYLRWVENPDTEEGGTL